ncbi:hypothetical protein GBAR_LOCUS22774 [Geodia barretti]|uniref:G-protein coupled receptors family 2 profile 2 domain-containing protein n=1 Tax=Geodia barretti TaxID=519541 RepID=A0AA35T489_GEOBA|nr:hypothetical protein GBAR_LOCUS22774 [Geodia barretti]
MFFPNETASVNNTGREAPKCSRDFFLDNSSGLCRPECGEWDQYSPATRRAVYGVNITFILVTIIVCVVTFVWSIFRRKIMFRYPNIILLYITFTRAILSILHLVGYTDEKALYCTSRDRMTSFEEGSAYCNIIGSATTFIPIFDLTGLCFHLGTVLFTAYFPFRARKLETKGGYKYLHVFAVICGVGFSIFLVGLQFAVGGFSRTVVPIFCLAASESAFVFGVIPGCFISAIFLTFVMVLLFKIINIQGWKLKRSQV